MNEKRKEEFTKVIRELIEKSKNGMLKNKKS